MTFNSLESQFKFFDYDLNLFQKIKNEALYMLIRLRNEYFKYRWIFQTTNKLMRSI